MLRGTVLKRTAMVFCSSFGQQGRPKGYPNGWLPPPERLCHVVRVCMVRHRHR
jgi:hypothetical protein